MPVRVVSSPAPQAAKDIAITKARKIATNFFFIVKPPNAPIAVPENRHRKVFLAEHFSP
jgi:hypothetical protein